MKRRRVTFRDLELRYRNIREANPRTKKCSVKGCSNPRDSTELLGEDTCCAYHRLLFDYWSCDVAKDGIRMFKMARSVRRRLFSRWMRNMGKKECDKIVLKLAQDPINWKC